MKHAAPPKKDTSESGGKAGTFPLVRRLSRTYLRVYVAGLCVAVLFMAMDAGMTASLAKLLQPILDDVLYGQKEDMIFPVALTVCGVFAVRGLSNYVHTVLMNRIGQSVVSDIQSDLFAHFMGLDLAFFHRNPSGQLISRVVNDVNVMRTTVSDTLTGFGKSAFTLLFLIGVMFHEDWKLTLAAFVVFPLLSGFVMYLGRKLRKMSGRIQHELGGLSDLLSQTFQGVRLVKAYNLEDIRSRAVKGAIARVRDLNVRAVRTSTLSVPVNDFLIGLIFAGIIVYGGYEVLAGRNTPGGLASFLAAFTMAYEPMKRLAKLNNSLQMGMGAAERVFAMMDQKSEIYDRDKAGLLKAEKPEIRFDGVSFSYKEIKGAGEDTKALNGIGFVAPPGKVTALVGPSGGGKSTILNLIARFYDVDEGCVSIDGRDVRDVTLRSLRENMALVSQDITIFNDTVFENIRYGAPDAEEDSVFAAAQAAAAHDFITELPQGYDTVVGENGARLSGGQKQRIAIARAILRDAPVLLLDEATSALDNESEKSIQKSLKALEKGRTTIVIAHRLTTVQSAHQILVLDRGCIAEQGTHDELLKAGGLYARMYETGLKAA